jgi:hypothetical protein
MNRKLMLAAILVATAAAPASAATMYYVSQDATTKACSVVDKKPDGKAAMEIGKAFKTKADADKALKADKQCKSM